MGMSRHSLTDKRWPVEVHTSPRCCPRSRPRVGVANCSAARMRTEKHRAVKAEANRLNIGLRAYLGPVSADAGCLESVWTEIVTAVCHANSL
jgi:hypothetical protein